MTTTSDTLTGGSQFVAGDFNGDGLTDVMISFGDNCGIWFGTNAGSFSASGMVANYTKWTRDPDGIWVGTDVTETPCFSMNTSKGVRAVNDFDGDGYSDVPIVQNHAAMTPYIQPLMNQRDGNLTQEGSFPGYAPVALGDFNGDGRIDLITHTTTSGSNSFYLSTGGGSFSVSGSSISSTTGIGVADFDDDGCADTFQSTGTANTIVYSSFCNPAATSASVSTFSGGTLVFGDFNGDGKTDILVVYPSSAGALYLSTGTGLSAATSFTVPSDWGLYTVVVGDFNGDGKQDIALIAAGGCTGCYAGGHDHQIATRTSCAYYDANGEFMIRAVNALGQQEIWSYDPLFGGPVSHTGPNGLTTSWSYDSFGRLLQESRPDGTSTTQSYGYCGCGGLTNGKFFSQTQTLGKNGLQARATSTAYYDMLSRAVAGDTQGFNGSAIRVSTQYDGIGRVAQSSRPYFLSGGTAKWTVFSYDALGRVTQSVAPDGGVTLTCYAGLNGWVQDAVGGTIETLRNAQGLNKLVAHGTNACGSDLSGASLKTSYEYDAFGNLVTVTDASGNVVTSSYDIRGNKYSTADPDMGNWTYVHDVLGELTSQTDAKSQTTSMSYDVLGRMTIRSEPGLYSTWAYGTSASSHNVGQLVEAKACTSSGSCTLVSDRLFYYDALGRPRLTQLQTASGYSAYTQSYNSQTGQLALINYPSGLVLHRLYNQYGFLCRLTDWHHDAPTCTSASSGTKVFWTANSRDAELHLTQSTSGNGMVLEQTFDPDTGLIQRQRAGPSTGPNWGTTASSTTLNWNTPSPNTWGGNVAAFNYTFDTIGRLTARADYNTGVNERYCYDTVNRLTTSATGTLGASVNTCTDSGTNIVSKSVSYDVLSNIAAKSDVGTYSYPASGSSSVRPHAIASVTGIADGLTNPVFQYDANGNLLCMSTGSNCTGMVGRQVSYTAFNMTAGITDTGTNLSLTYDSEHARISQSSTISGTTTVTEYLNDPASGAMSERVTVGSGTPSFVDYISADGLIVAQQTTTYHTTAMWGVAAWSGFNWGGYSSVTNWGSFNWGAAPWGGTFTPPTVITLYFVNDHLGSVAVVTDNTGAVVQRLSYDAWGKQRNPNGTDAACGAITSPTARGFTTQEQVPGGCLVNLNARLYDSQLGKFLTPDPVVGNIFTPNAFNRYIYAFDAPLSLFDPTGFDPITLGVETITSTGILGSIGSLIAPILGPIGVVLDVLGSFFNLFGGGHTAVAPSQPAIVQAQSAPITNQPAATSGTQAGISQLTNTVAGNTNIETVVTSGQVAGNSTAGLTQSMAYAGGPNATSAAQIIRSANPDDGQQDLGRPQPGWCNGKCDLATGQWGDYYENGSLGTSSNGLEEVGVNAEKYTVQQGFWNTAAKLGNAWLNSQLVAIAAAAAVFGGAEAAAAAEGAALAEGGVTVTREGLGTVISHLSQFGESEINQAMVDRLTIQVGSDVTGADANFYTHEILESQNMAAGMDYETAHAAALEKAGVSPYSLYHPEVMQQFPDYFNSNWRAFWGRQFWGFN